MAYPAAMGRLLEELERLPGIGPRTAERLACHLLLGGAERCRSLSRAIDEAQAEVGPCSRCFQLGDRDPCRICSDPERDTARLLVVSHPRDVEAMERAGWKGLYHVLMGTVDLTASDGDSGALTLDALRHRLEQEPIEEVVLGMSPDLDGDGTVLVLTELVEKLDVERLRVSRLARGLPVGSAIEYTNPAVLAEALQERRALETGGAP